MKKKVFFAMIFSENLSRIFVLKYFLQDRRDKLQRCGKMDELRNRKNLFNWTDEHKYEAEQEEKSGKNKLD